VGEEGLQQRNREILELHSLECAQPAEFSVTACHTVGYTELKTRVQGEWHKVARFSVNP